MTTWPLGLFCFLLSIGSAWGEPGLYGEYRQALRATGISLPARSRQGPKVPSCQWSAREADLSKIREELTRLADPRAELLENSPIRCGHPATEGRIGVWLDPHSRVSEVMPGSPAALAGLQVGDHITAGKLAGAVGSQANFVIERPDRNISFVLPRREMTVPTASGRLLPDGRTGYVRFHSLADTTRADLCAVLTNLGGAQEIVLDLRGIAGGYLSAATEVAGVFLPSHSKVVELVNLDGSSNTYWTDGTARCRLPLTVWVDDQTANFAEALAGCLIDNGAVLRGGPSAGRGRIVQAIWLSSGEGLVLTKGLLRTPSGLVFDSVGLR